MIPDSAIALAQQKYGTYGDKFDLNRWQFYDFIRYPTAGATELTFMAVALGQVDPNSLLAKTQEQTNISGNRQLNYDFLLYDIKAVCRWLPKGRQPSAISTDVDVIYTTMTNAMSKFLELMRRGTLNVNFGQKLYYDINQPFIMASPGNGIEIDQFGSVQVTQTLWALQPCNAMPFRLEPVQFVEQNQQLGITINYPDTSPAFTGLVSGGDPALEVGIVFDGFIIRPLQ